jgi:hypothetical protein
VELLSGDARPDDVAAITSFVDVTAPPVGPTAHLLFGTNQTLPADMVANRYHDGLVPLIVVTGGVNRHDGMVESREFRRRLVEKGVKESDIRGEERSLNTQQNVQFVLSHLREVFRSGIAITAVCKWYHRRAIHWLATLLPEAEAIHAITFEPIFSGIPITRDNWHSHPDGRHRVLREWHEVPQRIANGSFVELQRVDDTWRRVGTRPTGSPDGPDEPSVHGLG